MGAWTMICHDSLLFCADHDITAVPLTLQNIEERRQQVAVMKRYQSRYSSSQHGTIVSSQASLLSTMTKRLSSVLRHDDTTVASSAQQITRSETVTATDFDASPSQQIPDGSTMPKRFSSTYFMIKQGNRRKRRSSSLVRHGSGSSNPLLSASRSSKGDSGSFVLHNSLSPPQLVAGGRQRASSLSNPRTTSRSNNERAVAVQPFSGQSKRRHTSSTCVVVNNTSMKRQQLPSHSPHRDESSPTCNAQDVEAVQFQGQCLHHDQCRDRVNFGTTHSPTTTEHSPGRTRTLLDRRQLSKLQPLATETVPIRHNARKRVPSMWAIPNDNNNNDDVSQPSLPSKQELHSEDGVLKSKPATRPSELQQDSELVDTAAQIIALVVRFMSSIRLFGYKCDDGSGNGGQQMTLQEYVRMDVVFTMKLEVMKVTLSSETLFVVTKSCCCCQLVVPVSIC